MYKTLGIATVAIVCVGAAVYFANSNSKENKEYEKRKAEFKQLKAKADLMVKNAGFCNPNK